MKKFLIAMSLLAGNANATENSDTAGIIVDTQACPFDEAEALLPSITVTPWADVVVDLDSEFTAEETENGMKFTHTGSAATVRIPSVVSVFSSVEIYLQDEAKYCFDSIVGNVTVFTNGAKTVVHSSVGTAQVK